MVCACRVRRLTRCVTWEWKCAEVRLVCEEMGDSSGGACDDGCGGEVGCEEAHRSKGAVGTERTARKAAPGLARGAEARMGL